MKLFKKQSNDVEEPLSFESALLYVTGLSEEDWHKFTSVAHIRRYALQTEAEELGVQLLPKTFIRKPDAPIWNLGEDDPDADIFAVLEDDKPEIPETAKLKNFPGIPDGTEVKIDSKLLEEPQHIDHPVPKSRMEKTPLGNNPKNKVKQGDK